jgi:hypothetical protein
MPAEAVNYFVTEPMVLVLREEHDSRYYLVRDDAELNRAALTILRERDAEGWYTEPDRADYVDEISETTMQLYEQEVQAGRMARYPQWLQDQAREGYEQAKEHADRISRADLQYRIDAGWYRRMKRLLALPPDEALARVNTHGRPLAYLILRNRRAGEYEGFDLERFETVEG